MRALIFFKLPAFFFTTVTSVCVQLLFAGTPLAAAEQLITAVFSPDHHNPSHNGFTP